MNRIQQAGFEFEIAQARALMSRGKLLAALAHIERAHVFGQSHVIPHVFARWLMRISFF